MQQNYSRPKKAKSKSFLASTSSDSSQTKLKKEIRSIQRLLSRDDKFITTGSNPTSIMPATVRQAKQRLLKSLQDRLTEQQKVSSESQKTARFSKAKFFDRKKAERRLLQAQKSNKEDEPTNNSDNLENAIKDLNYVKFYPINLKYLSLFPSSLVTDESVAKDIKTCQKSIKNVIATLEDGERESFRWDSEKHGDPKTKESMLRLKLFINSKATNKQKTLNDRENDRGNDRANDDKDEKDDDDFFIKE